MTGSRLTLNTSSFVTYAQVYELSLIVSKDSRKGMVKMDIDLGVLPVPLLDIDCAAPGLCFPTFGGIFVNPTSRYFFKGLKALNQQWHYQTGLEELLLRGLRSWSDHTQLEHQVSKRTRHQNLSLWSWSHYIDHQHNNVSIRFVIWEHFILVCSSTESTTTTTLPPPISVSGTTFTDNVRFFDIFQNLNEFQVTSETFVASQSDTGITVSVESPSPTNSTRRKRSADPPPLVPDKYVFKKK